MNIAKNNNKSGIAFPKFGGLINVNIFVYFCLKGTCKNNRLNLLEGGKDNQFCIEWVH